MRFWPSSFYFDYGCKAEIHSTSKTGGSCPFVICRLPIPAFSMTQSRIMEWPSVKPGPPGARFASTSTVSFSTRHLQQQLLHPNRSALPAQLPTFRLSFCPRSPCFYYLTLCYAPISYDPVALIPPPRLLQHSSSRPKK